jgi:hypothetical protein
MEREVLTILPVHSKDWRTKIVYFLQGSHPSDDEGYIKRMQARTRPYMIIEGELFKQGVCSLLLKCLSRAEGQELMKEIHAGICGAHIESKPLLGKVFRQGFYWPKAASDAADLVQKCENCQKCARNQKQPSSLLGRRRRCHPSLDAFAGLAAPTETRRLADFTLRPTCRRTKAYDEVVPSCGLIQHGGPRVIRPIVTGPAWSLRITDLIYKGFPVITVCNPALWEYSGDNLGA